jgi:hypothetical protein
MHPEGLIGTMADWILSISRFPNRPLAVAAATAALSTLCGRHLYGPTGTALNLYIILLGRTGIGKDKPLKAAERLLCAAGFPQLAQTGKVFSQSGLERLIAEHPCCLGTIDEIVPSLLARALHRKASAHESGIRGPLMLLWSRTQGDPPYVTTLKADPKAPPNFAVPLPSLTVLGASTPQAFYDVLSSGQRSDGFLSRFLLCHATRRAKEAQEVSADALDVWPEIVDCLSTLVPRPKGNLAEAEKGITIFDLVITVPEYRVPWANDETKQTALAFEQQLDQIGEASPQDAELLVRVFETAVRLATLHAVGRAGSREGAEVDEQDWAWGHAWALSSAQQMIEDVGKYMADSDPQALARAIKRVINNEKNNGTATRRVLHRALDHRWKAKEVDEGVNSLVIAGQIKPNKIPSRPEREGGPPVLSYTWVGEK